MEHMKAPLAIEVALEALMLDTNLHAVPTVTHHRVNKIP